MAEALLVCACDAGACCRCVRELSWFLVPGEGMCWGLFPELSLSHPCGLNTRMVSKEPEPGLSLGVWWLYLLDQSELPGFLADLPDRDFTVLGGW